MKKTISYEEAVEALQKHIENDKYVPIEKREIYLSVGKRAITNAFKHKGYNFTWESMAWLTAMLPFAVDNERIMDFYETYIDYPKIKKMLSQRGYKEELEADTTGKPFDVVFYKEKDGIAYNIILGVKDESKTVGYFTNFVCGPEDIGKVDRKTMREVQDDAMEIVFECYKGDQR